jgi:acyl carrier protein
MRPADRIPPLLARAFAVDERAVTPQISLTDDLGADSLAVMEVVSMLEEELGIELPDTIAFVEQLRTVGDLVAAFEARAGPVCDPPNTSI